MKTIAEKMAQFVTGEIEELTGDEILYINGFINQYQMKLHNTYKAKNEEKSKRNIEKLSKDLKRLRDDNLLISAADLNTEHIILLSSRCFMTDGMAADILGIDFKTYKNRRIKLGLTSLINMSLTHPIEDDEIKDIVKKFIA
jgi:hypothetical protein